MDSNKNIEVRKFWNSNPFTYNSVFGVGYPGLPEELDINFFIDCQRRYIKHQGGSTELLGSKVAFSRYINYSKLQNKHVLDVAIGSGFSTVNFAKSKAKVTAIDLTEFAVRLTKRNLFLHNLKANVMKMDCQNLKKIKSNNFDFCCAHGCLMHMPDTLKALKEIYRVLKPSASGYAWMYHKGWYYYFGILFLRGVVLMQLIRHRFNILKLTSRYTDGSSIGGNPHTKFYSQKEIIELFSSAGFKNVKVFYNYNTSEWDAWPIASLNLGKFIPEKIKKFCSLKLGFSNSITITFDKI